MAQMFNKPGMGGGASAPLPSGGIQGGSRPLQQNAQRMVPNPGQFNGNPRGVYNTNFMGQGNAPSSIQQTNLGRYTPPTMQDGGRYGFNSNTWNNSGGYNYNLPGSYGSPQGQGQFAPMPGQFQQYMQPGMLSGNTFGYGNPFGQGMGQGETNLGSFLDAYRPGGHMYTPRDPAFQQQIRDAMGTSGGMNQGGMGGTGRGMSNGSYSDYLSGFRSRADQNPGGFQTGDFRVGEDIPLSEQEWRAQQGRGGRPQFGQQVRGQLNQFGFNDLQIADDPQAFREWAAEAMNSPGQDPQYAAQIRAQLERMGGPMAPDKMGRRPNQAGPAPMPAYDNPANRQYNMNALYQMMGGF